MNTTDSVKAGFYGWKNVVLLFVIYMASFGLVFYGYSVIFPMMIKALNWNRGTASIAHMVLIAIMGLTTPLVAVSIKKYGVKRTVIFGMVVLLTGLVLIPTITTQIWQWVILWGVFIGVGLSFSGLVPVQTMLMYWFNIKRGTAIGIVMTGAGLGGFAAQPFYTWIMMSCDTWKTGWLSSAMMVLIGLICSFFLINKPEDVAQHPDGLNHDDINSDQTVHSRGARTHRTSDAWQLRDVFKTPTIWFVAVVSIGYLMAFFFITSHGVLYLTDKGFSQMQAASMLSFVIMGSGIAKFPAGWLGDRIEPRWIFVVSLGVMLIMFTGIWKISNPTLIAGMCITFGFCYGTQLVMHPTLMGNYYGPKAFPAIAGVMGPFLVLIPASVPMVAGYIFEKTGNYNLAFAILSIVVSAAFIASFMLIPPVLKRS